jgi:ABC-2 type transport system ATP-binding protein
MEALLELDGLTRRYGDRVALDGLSFDVAAGRLFGFVGPNGAGKTTAMRIVVGVLEPDAGEVRWRGARVDAAMRRRFGYMPEERGLYPKMRVRAQLEYLARLHGMTQRDAAGAAARWIARLGLAERAGDRVEKLSLGNQQRVQLAAALVHAPDVLVLDEPFSGLDPVGVDVMSAVLAEETARGVPVLFSSHQLELVERLCDAVAIVNDGRLVARGGVQELREQGARDRRRVRVELAEPPPVGWLAGIGAAWSVQPLPRGALIELGDGASPDAVLDAARAAGSVTHFALERPTLAELFREAVAG